MDCPQISSKKSRKSIAVTFCHTRLGNQLSAFASTYSLWRRYGMHNYINDGQFQQLTKVFELPLKPQDKENGIGEWPYYVWNNGL